MLGYCEGLWRLLTPWFSEVSVGCLNLDFLASIIVQPPSFPILHHSHALRGNAALTAPAVRDAERRRMHSHAERGNDMKTILLIFETNKLCTSLLSLSISDLIMPINIVHQIYS